MTACAYRSVAPGMSASRRSWGTVSGLAFCGSGVSPRTKAFHVTFVAMLRTSLDSLPPSRIREVANAALGRDDIVKFWFGEGDQPTPSFIREAAKAALDAGDTFYNHNLGLIELREALARYLNTLHAPRTRIDVERIAVTSAGINALSLIAQALFDPGDRVAIVTPVWPNVTSIPRILSVEVVRVPLDCRA